MKKLLALVLALVMSMSLVTISNAAFKDADQIDYNEAVEVMNAVGVLVGSNGSFEPKAELTREQAAKIIAYLDLGSKTAENLPAVKVFNDVEADRWSAKFVAYCADAGYVNGVGNGNFDPAGKLTGLQFAKMLLCVLGYETAREGLVGSDWAIATAKLAAKNDLFTDIEKSSTAVLTREEGAQVAFNALKSDTYEYALDGTTVKGDGFEVITGGSKASVVRGNKNYDGKGEGDQQLCEKLYGTDLRLTVNTDSFGRPNNSWKYKTNDIGDYAKTPTLIYTGEVKGKEIFADLGNPNLTGANFVAQSNDAYVVNGDTEWTLRDIARNNDNKHTSHDGVVTEVFYDTDVTPAKLTVVSYSYYLAQANENFDTKDNEVKVTIYSSLLHSATLSADDFNVENVKKDDYLVVTIANGDVQSVEPATVVSKAQVSAARNNDYVTANGTKYTYAFSLVKDSGATVGQSYATNSSNYSLSNTEYNLFLDPNGFVVGIELNDTEVADVSKYLFVEQTSTNGFDNIAKAKFTDGSKKTITVAEKDGKDSFSWAASNGDGNKFYKFTVKSNGEYKLTSIPNPIGNAKVGQGSQLNASLTDGTKPVGGKVANNATVYLTKNTVFTGVKNAPKVNSATNNTYYLYNDSNVLLFVYATETGAAVTNTDNYVYILNANYAVAKDGDDEYYIYKAIVKGEKTELKANDAGKGVGLYKVETYTDGRADLKTPVTKDVADEVTYVPSVSTAKVEKGVLTVDSAAYVITDDCVIRTVDGTTVKSISASGVENAVKDDFKEFYMLQKSSDNTDIVVLYLVKVK
jgi:hypothetical protein